MPGPNRRARRLKQATSLDELTGFSLVNPNAGDLLVYDAVDGQFENSKTLTGDYTVAGTLTAEDLVVNDDLTVNDALVVSGTTTLDTLTVQSQTALNDAVTISSTLAVTGAVTLSDTLSVAGALTGSSLSFSGDSAFGGNLTVAGTLSTANLSITGSLSLAGDVSAGNATFSGNLAADNITATSSLSVGAAFGANAGAITTELTVGTDLLVGGQIFLDSASATDPALAFLTDTDSGRFYDTTNTRVAESFAGVEVMNWNAGRMQLEGLNLSVKESNDAQSRVAVWNTTVGGVNLLANASGGTFAAGLYQANESTSIAEGEWIGLIKDGGVGLFWNDTTNPREVLRIGENGGTLYDATTESGQTSLHDTRLEWEDDSSNLLGSIGYNATSAMLIINHHRDRVVIQCYNNTLADGSVGNLARLDWDDLVLYHQGTPEISFGTSGSTFARDVEIDGDLDHDGTNIGFFGTAPVAQAAAYTPTNVTTDRAYDANSTTLDEVADVLGTLIADLQAYGLLQ